MSLIATLTLNPALDVSYKIQRMVNDEKLHSFETRFDAGGNGINVARALKKLGFKASACCVLAGEIGKLISNTLTGELDDPHFVWGEGETRINCVIHQIDPVTQYQIDGSGPDIDSSAIDRLEKDLYENSKGGFAVITGSCPLNISSNIYYILTARLQKLGVKCLIDADGDLLKNAVKAKPYIIKPNIHELKRLMNRNINSVIEAAYAAQELQKYGIEYVFVSLGHEGAILASSEGVFHAESPEVPVVSSVGAGDSMVAGLLSVISSEDGNSVKALKLGIACGSATVQKPGTELFTMDLVDKLIDKIQIEQLKL